jgi:hypothetical protein
VDFGAFWKEKSLSAMADVERTRFSIWIYGKSHEFQQLSPATSAQGELPQPQNFYISRCHVSMEIVYEDYY